MKNVIITILSIIVIGLASYIVYDKVISNNNSSNKTDEKENSNTNNEQEKEINSNTLNELYTLINVDPQKEFNYCHTLNLDLLNYNGLISNMDKETKQRILYWYAVNNKYMATVTGNEYSYCKSGMGEECNGLSKENYKKIAKKYNITDDFDELFDNFEKYNGMALQTWVNLGGCDYNTKHNLNSKYVGNNIVIEDTVDYYTFAVENPTKTNTKNVKYTFNKLSDGTYALYSVESK